MRLSTAFVGAPLERRARGLVSLFIVWVACWVAPVARADFVAPNGYQTVDLGLTANGFGVSAGGRLVVAKGSTLTLYNTFQNGRTQIASVSDSADWGYLTDAVFVNESTVVFGENGKSNTLWSVNFATATPTVTKLAASNAFPAIQDVALTADHGRVVVSGTTAPFGSLGGLYLDQFNLATSTITPVVTNTGTGYVGGPGVTAAGAGVLLDTGTAAGIARVYNLATGTPLNTISLAPGGGSGAFAMAFDSAGNAYVTTGVSIARIADIDTASPAVSSFGTFSEGTAGFPFPTGIAFTGGDFDPNSGGSGALVVNGGFTSEGELFAVVPAASPSASVPLPAGAGSGLLLAVLLLAVAAIRRAGSPLSQASKVAAAVALAAIGGRVGADQFYASQYVVAGTIPGIGQALAYSDPTLALGAPHGAGASAGNSTDVYNLGVGGQLTLGFDSNGTHRVIRDLAGSDFIVFENAFYSGGDTASSFAELMFVEVSSDGTHFARFPTVSNTVGPVGPYGTIDPADVSGFAGVHPVLANVDTNSINPFDPAVAGGDAFDLSTLANDPLVLSHQVDLNNIGYVRLIDVLGDGSVLDSRGQSIYDPTGPGSNGADVDALAVINGVQLPEPASLGVLMLTAAGALHHRPPRA